MQSDQLVDTYYVPLLFYCFIASCGICDQKKHYSFRNSASQGQQIRWKKEHFKLNNSYGLFQKVLLTNVGRF